MRNEVALVSCDSYEQEKVDLAIEKGFELLGGIKKYVKKGQVVALKVNLVHKASPEEAVTTHPSVVLAVAKQIKEIGADCFIVDSSGGPYNESYMSSIYNASGMTKLKEEHGIRINDNYGFSEVEVDGVVSKKLLLLDALLKADVIFNLCKLKTHGFTGISNAVKNMFGAIPGLTKVEYHGKFQNLESFNQNLFDIHKCFDGKLTLHISDAIIGMEGEGPTHGTPRKIGAILMGENPASVDVLGCKIINIDPNEIPTIKVAKMRGFLDDNLDFEVVGENIEKFIIKDYKNIKPNDYTPFASAVPKFLQKLMNRWSNQRPVISCKKCKGCGKCEKHCPQKAITMKMDKKGKRHAVVDYQKCIRCFCCQELCPFGVVKIKSGWFFKLQHRKDKKKQKINLQKNGQKN